MPCRLCRFPYAGDWIDPAHTEVVHHAQSLRRPAALLLATACATTSHPIRPSSARRGPAVAGAPRRHRSARTGRGGDGRLGRLDGAAQGAHQPRPPPRPRRRPDGRAGADPGLLPRHPPPHPRALPRRHRHRAGAARPSGPRRPSAAWWPRRCTSSSLKVHVPLGDWLDGPPRAGARRVPHAPPPRPHHRHGRRRRRDADLRRPRRGGRARPAQPLPAVQRGPGAGGEGDRWPSGRSRREPGGAFEGRGRRLRRRHGLGDWPCPGHTRGSTAYLVRTPQGPVLLTGDACHTRWGWEHDVEPGNFSGDVARQRGEPRPAAAARGRAPGHARSGSATSAECGGLRLSGRRPPSAPASPPAGAPGPPR